MALCHDTHEECPKPSGIMPSRAIDVGTKQPITYVYIGQMRVRLVIAQLYLTAGVGSSL